MIGVLIFIALVVTFYFNVYRRWNYKQKFTCKTIMIYLSLICTIFWGWYTIDTIVAVVETEQRNMLESRLERAERTVRNDDWSWFADHMDLDRNYEKEFEYLWERLYMYTASGRYRIFNAASKANLGEKYDDKAVFWQEKLLEICKEPVYEENISYGRAFLEQTGLVNE